MRKLCTLTLSLILCFIVFPSVVLVEADSLTWSKTYGGTGYESADSLVATSDGGYAIAGYSTGFDFWLVKTDACGNMEWNQTYGGTGYRDTASLVETSDGGYAMVGSNLLIKTDASGNMEWKQTLENGTFSSLVETSDGGYAMGGRTRSLGEGSGELWLVKTDVSGNMEWNQTYGDGSCLSLVATSDGGYALAGYFNAEVEVFWLVKTDAFGNMEWNKTYVETGGFAYSVVKTSDGGYALAGYTHFSGAFYPDCCLVKIDEFGNMEWNKTYGGPDTDYVRSLVATSDGGYAIAGNTNSSGAGLQDFWLIKTDYYGNMEWKRTYGGTDSDEAASLVETSDGGYVIAGNTYSFGAGNADFWLVKTYERMYTEDFDTYEFDFSYGDGLYIVVVSTNSTIGNFDFGINQNQTSFSVTGTNGTIGFCKIAFPEEMVGGVFPIYLNGKELVEDVDYTRSYNGTHTIFEITYSHSTHIIEIIGTNVIPEFPLWTSMLFILTVFPITLAIYKSRFTKKREEQ